MHLMHLYSLIEFTFACSYFCQIKRGSMLRPTKITGSPFASLIPREVPTIEKKKGKKDQDKKKPFVSTVQGSKPGKSTDLSRMRQILVKLKHNTLPHLKP